jgi:hypothetical protein
MHVYIDFTFQVKMWFEIQGETTTENLNLKIGLWKQFANNCLDQSKELTKGRYAIEWLLYLAEYYRLLSYDQMVINQFLQNKSSKRVYTDTRLISALKLLRTPGSDKILIQQAIESIFTPKTNMPLKSQFHWPRSIKSESITTWTLLLPLLIFKKPPQFLGNLITQDILPYYDQTWKHVN